MTDETTKQEVRRLRGIIREQGETIEQQNERIEDLEGENDDPDDLVEVRSDDPENGTLEDVWIAGLPLGKILDKIETKTSGIGNLEERIAALEADQAGEDVDQGDDRSPLAQLIDLPKEKAKEVLTENQARARTVAQRARELGTKTKAGLVVKSRAVKETLRDLGDSDHDETVRRVMDFIADFGKGEVATKMHKGKRILVFDPDRVEEYGTGEEPDVIHSPRDVISVRESEGQPAPS